MLSIPNNARPINNEADERFLKSGASPGFGRGGPRIFFFQTWEFACREAIF